MKKISIVTAYYNRRKLFYNTLKTIEYSKNRDLVEIIAVDDASDINNRIDDFPSLFKLDIKVIRIDEKDKWWMNPVMPFNIGFKAVSSDIVLIQNPECMHYGEVIDYAINNTKDNTYITYGCYSVDGLKTKEINKINFNSPNYTNSLGRLLSPLVNRAVRVDGETAWYNHSQYRPHMLHFCSSITKKDLDELEGFDEIYAKGIGYDDNDFLLRIQRKGMNIQVVDRPFVIHQFHGVTQYGAKQEFVQKNAIIYNDILKNGSGHKHSTKIIKNKKMKIIGFTQLRNELEKGNLENWFKCMLPICDYIYIFDQNSTDGSLEYYKQFPNVVVIASPTNRFKEELLCKIELLDKVKVDHPDTNFIMWLDGDEIIDGRLLRNNGQVFRDLCGELWNDTNQAYKFGHKNLWRSDVHERLDDGFAGMDGNGVCKLWKFNMNLNFSNNPGLHHEQYPINLTNIKRLDFSLIHRGFATDFQIMTKYDVYKSNGQSGWALERLLEESTLKVQKINYEMLPSWFELKDEVNPINKKKIREIYNEQKH